MGDWNTKVKNCLTDEERVVVKECFDNRSKDLLVKVRWLASDSVDAEV